MDLELFPTDSRSDKYSADSCGENVDSNLRDLGLDSRLCFKGKNKVQVRLI